MAAISSDTNPPLATKKPPGLWAGIQQAIQTSAEQQREARARRYERPQPWIVRKLAVFMVFGILGYTYYVYIVRFCVKMIRERSDAQGSRALGVVYTIVFNILFLALLWAYAKVLFTPPGFARDHVPKCPQPEPRSPERHPLEYSMYSGSESILAGPPYASSQRELSIHSSIRNTSPDAQHTTSSPPPPVPLDLERGNISAAMDVQTSSPSAEQRAASPVESTAQAYARSYIESLRTSNHRLPMSPPQSHGFTSRGDDDLANNVVELDALPGVAALHAAEPDEPASANQKPSKSDIRRKPNSTPVLSLQYRYCRRDEIIKPPRTHHCRICGTCTLMFDHHCPWIGQCVGARNRRFFLIFCEYNTIFCLWVAVTLIIGVTTHSDHVDGQEIAIIVLAILFTFFTGGLSIAHTQLIMLNATTVEQLSIQSMRHREQALLNSAFEIWDIRGKRRKQREWDEEWGRVGREGNLWWLGSSRANWEAMMGPSPRYWFLPIGKNMSDGLTFETNPRFDEDGRWRRRIEWPSELQ